MPSSEQNLGSGAFLKEELLIIISFLAVEVIRVAFQGNSCKSNRLIFSKDKVLNLLLYPRIKLMKIKSYNLSSIHQQIFVFSREKEPPICRNMHHGYYNTFVKCEVLVLQLEIFYLAPGLSQTVTVCLHYLIYLYRHCSWIDT